MRLKVDQSKKGAWYADKATISMGDNQIVAPTKFGTTEMLEKEAKL
jgi:hypothetical protein